MFQTCSSIERRRKKVKKNYIDIYLYICNTNIIKNVHMLHIFDDAGVATAESACQVISNVIFSLSPSGTSHLPCLMCGSTTTWRVCLPLEHQPPSSTPHPQSCVVCGGTTVVHYRCHTPTHGTELTGCTHTLTWLSFLTFPSMNEGWRHISSINYH